MAYTFRYGDRPIDGITVQRAVGRGGFGEVYYALTDSGKQVALKYLRDNPEVELRGISHVMNLKSPHLITIYDVRRNEEGDPFVVMEYISGPSLRELLLAAPSGLGPQKAAFFTLGMAKGLAYLHDRGIVHRDLKPANIFYDDGYVKIGDYGLSKHIAVSRHSAQTVSVGTVHYMAPEIGSGNYTKAIDIYALGVMLYEMLTGRLPFTGSSMAEVLMKHVSDRPNLAGIPEPFATVIARALVKDPAGRYQDVNEMVDALMEVASISQSVASFDPATLSQIGREAAPDPDRTLTRPGPVGPPPSLDVRGLPPSAPLPGFPEIPPIPGELTGRAKQRAERLQRKLAEQAAQARQLGQRIGQQFGGLLATDSGSPRISRWPQILTVGFSAFAIAAGLGLIGGPSSSRIEAVVALMLMLAGGIVGPLVAHFVAVMKNPVRNGLLERIVYAGSGALAMMPGFAVAEEEISGDFSHLIVPMIAVLFLFDWYKRIEAGRRLRLSGGDAILPGIAGLIIAAMAGADSYVWVGAGMCASLAILTQATAAAWPTVSGGDRGSPITMPPPLDVDQYVGRREPQGAGAGPQAGGAPPSAEQRAGQPGGWSEPPRAGLPPLPQAATATVVYEDAQPSFVGRTANAGLSFLAKLMILAGVALAFAYHVRGVTLHRGDTVWTIDSGSVQKFEGSGEHERWNVPRPAFMAPIIAGAVLLLIARRGDGAAHILRGAAACLLGLFAAGLVAGPGAGAIADISESGARVRVIAQHANVLVPAAALLLFAFMLMTWPKRRRHRPIVI